MTSFAWHGVVFAVQSPDRALVEAVPTRLPTGARPCDGVDVDVLYTALPEREGGDGTAYSLAVRTSKAPATEIARVPSRDLALSLLLHDAEFRTACHATDDVFLHAAVLGWQGRAILLPGYSFAGKSTLAAALVRLGAVYYSDEYAVLGRDGLVYPFARPIAMRTFEGRDDRRLRPEQLGGVAGETPLPLGAVIVTRYVAGAQWCPRPLTAGQMTLAMLEHAVTARTRPAHTLARIALAVGSVAIGLRGERGEAEPTARALLGRLFDAAD